MKWLRENAGVITVLILAAGFIYTLHSNLDQRLTRRIERVEDQLIQLNKDVAWIKGRLEKGNVTIANNEDDSSVVDNN